MTEGLGFKDVRRIAFDAAIGLALFTGFVFAAGIDSQHFSAPQFADLLSTSAYASQFAPGGDHQSSLTSAASMVQAALPVPPSGTDTVFQRTGPQTALVLLAGVFMAATAFNLWFFRHLRRVYASPRRGAWRRS